MRGFNKCGIHNLFLLNLLLCVNNIYVRERVLMGHGVHVDVTRHLAEMLLLSHCGFQHLVTLS